MADADDDPGQADEGEAEPRQAVGAVARPLRGTSTPSRPPVLTVRYSGPSPLPGQHVEDPHLVAVVARRVNATFVARTLEAALAIAAVVIELMFDGDVRRYLEGSAGHVSLRALADHPELRVSAAFLSTALGVYVQLAELPPEARGLSFSHQRALLPVKNAEKKAALALRAVREGMTSKALVRTARTGAARSVPRRRKEALESSAASALPAERVATPVSAPPPSAALAPAPAPAPTDPVAFRAALGAITLLTDLGPFEVALAAALLIPCHVDVDAFARLGVDGIRRATAPIRTLQKRLDRMMDGFLDAADQAAGGPVDLFPDADEAEPPGCGAKRRP